MSTTEELPKFRKSESEIETDYNYVQKVCRSFCGAISMFTQQLMSEEDAVELAEYFRFFLGNHDKDALSFNVNMTEIKTFFLILSHVSDADDIDKVLSYLESEEFGWHGNNYYLRNPCLRRSLHDPQGHCKRAEKIKYSEIAEEMLIDVSNIFFNNEISSIVLNVFTYCLASVFSSILNTGGVSVPLFLQIAVDKSSATYQVLKEIVEICDVNSGLSENCNKANSIHGQCDCTPLIYYPTQSIKDDIDNLTSNFKDRPVLVVGHENERYYAALLREVANIPIKKKPLDLRDRFNLYPIFICPTIKSSFDNVFSIDLTELQVSNEYLTLIRKRKQMLASWVMEFITNPDRQPFQQNEEDDKRRIAQKRNLISRKISPYINQVSQKYPQLTLNNAKNVAILNFFIKGFLTTFRRLCTFHNDEQIKILEKHGQTDPKSIDEVISILGSHSENLLAELHHRYLPMPTASSIKDADAIRLAKRIVKYYRELKVYIRVIPAEVNEDRYIFTVDTLSMTKDVDVSKNAETVQRRLKKYEWFRVDLKDPTSIRLVIAEKTLSDNNLIKMLKHPDFVESKMEIPYAMGFDDSGAMRIEDIVEFPHLLLGGATKSGKSTAIMSLLMSIAYKHRTGNVNVLVLDLLNKEKSDFNVFNGQPFMAAPVISDPAIARKAILSLHEESRRRLKNSNLSDMPYIVCVIDEFPRLYSGIKNRAYTDQLQVAVDELLSSGRHSRIHLVLAAQDPVKASMRGSIANITARIALKCASYHNSKAILGQTGANKLIGRGQMIFASSFETGRRLQGSYISPKEMKELLSKIKPTFKQQNKHPFSVNTLTLNSDSAPESSIIPEFSQSLQVSADDEKLVDAIMWILPQERIANSRLQKQCQIGNDRANRILSQMEGMKLIFRLHGKLGWETIPRSFENMPFEVIDYLKANGVTEDMIRDVFNKRSRKLDIPIEAENIETNGITQISAVPSESSEAELVQESGDMDSAAKIESALKQTTSSSDEKPQHPEQKKISPKHSFGLSKNVDIRYRPSKAPRVTEKRKKK